MYTQDLSNDSRGTGSVPEYIEMDTCHVCWITQPEERVHAFKCASLLGGHKVCVDCQPKEIREAAEAEDVSYLEELVNFKF